MPSLAAQRGGDPWYRRLFSGNGALWALYFILVLFSLLAVGSAISSEFYKSMSRGGLNLLVKHILMLALGTGVAVLTARISGRRMRYGLVQLATPAVLIMFLLQVFLGHSTNGAERWINVFGLFTIQPSEFIRVYIILQGASIAGTDIRENPKKIRGYIAFWVLVLAPSTISIFNNISTGLIFITVLYIYSWVLKAPKKFMYWVSLIFGGIVALALLWTLLAPVQYVPGRLATARARIYRAVEGRGEKTSVELNDENLQPEVARMAIARSKVVGVGVGKSKMRDILPQAYSDYIYAIIIEEWGIVGLLLVPGIYVFWMYVAWREARKQTSVFRSNLLKGFGILYPLQALVNMVVASGIITTGQTLPMLSFGGSSIIATSIAFGLVIGASRVDRKDEAKDKKTPTKPTEEADYEELDSVPQQA